MVVRAAALRPSTTSALRHGDKDKRAAKSGVRETSSLLATAKLLGLVYSFETDALACTFTPRNRFLLDAWLDTRSIKRILWRENYSQLCQLYVRFKSARPICLIALPIVARMQREYVSVGNNNYRLLPRRCIYHHRHHHPQCRCERVRVA